MTTRRILLSLGSSSTRSGVEMSEPVAILGDMTSSASAIAASKKMKRRAKPFQTHHATVIGSWPYGGSSPTTSAEFSLAGGTVGRLHACELPGLVDMDEGSAPMTEFLAKNQGKRVEVKVICVGKPNTISRQGQELMEEEFGTSRFVECTMLAHKLAEGKKKLRLINYQTDFIRGERLPVFVVAHAPTNSEPDHLDAIGGEINPLFKFTTNVPSNNVQSPYSFATNGQLVHGAVEGVNKTRRGRIVQLRLEGMEGEDTPKTRIHPAKPKIKNEPKDEPSDTHAGLEIDPGLDWSLAGFSVADLANVAMAGEVSKKDSKRKKKTADSRAAVNEVKVEFPAVELGLQLPQSGHSSSSSHNWIKAIAHFASQGELGKARAMAERALDSVDGSDTGEHTNLWTAYLNLELAMGTEERLKEIFARACGALDSYSTHVRLLEILKNTPGRDEDVLSLYESTLKKFRHAHLGIWTSYAEYLYAVDEAEKARALLQRAVQCLDQRQHLLVLPRFAQLEYTASGGDEERGKTMFEKILHTYPKQTDIWTLYIDSLMRKQGIIEARKVYERAVQSASNPAQLYKKWLDAEERHGTETSQNAVRERMVKHLEAMKKRDAFR